MSTFPTVALAIICMFAVNGDMSHFPALPTLLTRVIKLHLRFGDVISTGFEVCLNERRLVIELPLHERIILHQSQQLTTREDVWIDVYEILIIDIVP